MVEIRPEKPADYEAIHEVVTEAFRRPEEAELVTKIREAGLLDLGLVAIVEGELAAHVAFSPVAVSGSPVVATGLAPLAVHPDYQGQGIGKKLVWSGVERCRKRGIQAIFVLGDPRYYRHFGFRAAGPLGIACNYEAPAGAFQCLELTDGVLQKVTGKAVYDFETL
jgi:putative acetyltransferase